jgi:hypothetical protein
VEVEQGCPHQLRVSQHVGEISRLAEGVHLVLAAVEHLELAVGRTFAQWRHN